MADIGNTTPHTLFSEDSTMAAAFIPKINLTSGPEFQYMHEKLMSVYVWPLIMITTFASLGSIGNAIVLYIYWRKWKKTKTRVFILCLGLLDITNCVFNMPVEIAVLWRPLEFNLHYLCKISRGCTFVINNTGSLVLVSIAIERYLSVYYPLKSRALTPKFAKTLCFISFVVATSVSWPAFVFYGSHTLTIPWNTTTNVRGKTCLISDEHEFRTGLILIFTTVLFIGLILIFLVLTILYIAIGRKIYMVTCTDIGDEKANTSKLLGQSIISALTGVTKSPNRDKNKETKASCKKSSKSIVRNSHVTFDKPDIENPSNNQNLSRDKNLTPRNSRRFSSANSHATRQNTYMMRVVTIAFMLSFTPFMCILVIRYTNPKYYLALDIAQKTVYQVFIRTYFINSMVNPFIYGFMNARFRVMVKEMFRSVFCSSCCKAESTPVYRRNMSTVTFTE